MRMYLFFLVQNGSVSVRSGRKTIRLHRRNIGEEDGKYANVYAFIKYLSQNLPQGNMTVVSNGSACVVGSHNYVIQKDSRFLINSAVASMGYGLPAAIGACIANGKKDTICLEGDGSIMMNLQELQTVLTNKLPIKIFVINNQGYHSIRQTQNNLFKEHCKIGIGPEELAICHSRISPNYLKRLDILIWKLIPMPR